MRVLVVGSGGREHAIIKALKKSPVIEKLYCAPGNGGIAMDARCVAIRAMDFDALIEFAKAHVDITVVGSDDPLVGGIVDAFQAAGLKIFGPNKKAAQIEGSKSFAKDFMVKYGIPTAAYKTFKASTYADAIQYVQAGSFPVVVKADGLALGKGVVICQNLQEADTAIKEMLFEGKFGLSGNKVVIEEFLVGRELSVLAFCDGKSAVPMVAATDYKRIYDENKGPNTGGMGSVSPPPFYNEHMEQEYIETIIKPTINGMIKEDRPFCGVLYFGLIETDSGVKVIEYNCRFGDPEAQVVLMRLETDLLYIINACMDSTIGEIDIKWKEECSLCVIKASGGYPGDYEKGFEITGAESAQAGIELFHAGTALENGKFYTNGGRVIGICALGKTIKSARETAYLRAESVIFSGSQCRSDIGL